jgi:hypothetical protein
VEVWSQIVPALRVPRAYKMKRCLNVVHFTRPPGVLVGGSAFLCPRSALCEVDNFSQERTARLELSSVQRAFSIFTSMLGSFVSSIPDSHSWDEDLFEGPYTTQNRTASGQQHCFINGGPDYLRWKRQSVL